MTNLKQYKIDILKEDLETATSIIEELKNQLDKGKQLSVLSELRHWIKERRNIIDTLISLDEELQKNYSYSDEVYDEIEKATSSKMSKNKNNRADKCALIETHAAVQIKKHSYIQHIIFPKINLLARPPTDMNNYSRSSIIRADTT